MQALVEQEPFDVPDPEDDLSGPNLAGLHREKSLKATIDECGRVPDDQPDDRGLETDHVPLVHADAGHLLPRAQVAQEPAHPEPEVDDDRDVEEREEQVEQEQLVGLALREVTAAFDQGFEKANSSCNRLGREDPLDDGGTREYGVHHLKTSKEGNNEYNRIEKITL